MSISPGGSSVSGAKGSSDQGAISTSWAGATLATIASAIVIIVFQLIPFMACFLPNY
jgi:hypothetical protein